jgi:hypothetical protein
MLHLCHHHPGRGGPGKSTGHSPEGIRLFSLPLRAGHIQLTHLASSRPEVLPPEVPPLTGSFVGRSGSPASQASLWHVPPVLCLWLELGVAIWLCLLRLWRGPSAHHRPIPLRPMHWSGPTPPLSMGRKPRLASCSALMYGGDRQ